MQVKKERNQKGKIKVKMKERKDPDKDSKKMKGVRKKRGRKVEINEENNRHEDTRERKMWRRKIIKRKG
jgi:hypothetical protein